MDKQKPFQQQALDQLSKEAMGIAKSIQRPEQTKQQTKLIAQGISKGIEIYKKQLKEKNRHLDREKKKVARKSVELEKHQILLQTETKHEISKKISLALAVCGAFFGIAAILMFGLFVFNVDITIANYLFSPTIFIAAVIPLVGLSVWMFWARCQ